MNALRWWAAAVLALLLAGCASDAPVQTDPDQDGPGRSDLRASDVRDAVPQPEPRARYGNMDSYEVFGKRYYVSDTAVGYHERGTASWYGRKFHGRSTSSGEPYDMHLATAAHKTLPLPTYAEVTNLDNGKTVVVKINDRGPFVDDRIIDMSYGAALRLDMIKTGTARVEVRAITFDEEPRRPTTKVSEGSFLQVGAFRRRDSADELAGRMMEQAFYPVSIMKGGGLHKVWVGPFKDDAELQSTARRLVDMGYDRPHKVTP